VFMVRIYHFCSLAFGVAAVSGVVSGAVLQLPLDRRPIIRAANACLHEPPRTITAFPCKRDPGGIHEYYSEGTYWWPNPKNPKGPYIRRDGYTNPNNFRAHKKALGTFSSHVSALTAAWMLTHQQRYAAAAIANLRAWFVTPATMMAPNLQYSQAIPGICTGRGIGIIDTVRLVPVARSAEMLERGGALHGREKKAVNQWFAAYLNWMITSRHGRAEMRAKNNHGTFWTLQAAIYAKLIGDKPELVRLRRRFKTVLLPRQMAANGSFPRELARTKPFGYSLFNLNAMCGVCEVLSTPADNLWNYTTANGRNMRLGLRFLYPYMLHKSKWPYRHDVQHWSEKPQRPPAYLFGGLAYQSGIFLRLWKSLNGGRHSEDWFNSFMGPTVLWVKTG
jgi:hypothetical protein